MNAEIKIEGYLKGSVDIFTPRLPFTAIGNVKIKVKRIARCMVVSAQLAQKEEMLHRQVNLVTAKRDLGECNNEK